MIKQKKNTYVQYACLCVGVPVSTCVSIQNVSVQKNVFSHNTSVGVKLTSEGDAVGAQWTCRESFYFPAQKVCG